MKTQLTTHILFISGFHDQIYIGCLAQDNVFHSVANTKRNFDICYLVARNASFNIKPSYVIKECVFPVEFINLISQYTASFNSIANNLLQLEFPKQYIRDHRSVTRKADYLITKTINDYAGIKEYYGLIDNNTNRKISIRIHNKDWGVFKHSLISDHERFIELSQNEFNAILNQNNIADLSKYWEFSDTALKFMGYIFGINRWYSLYNYND